MAKKPQVLGNDPFQRGAADRSVRPEAREKDAPRNEEATAEARSKTQPKVEAQVAPPKAGARGKTRSKPETEVKARSKSQAEAKTTPKSQAKAKPTPKVDGRSKPQPMAEGRSRPQSKAEAKSKPKTKSKPADMAEPQPEAASSPGPKLEAKALPASEPQAKAPSQTRAEPLATAPPLDHAAPAGQQPRSGPPASGIDAIYASIIALRRMLHLPSAVSGAEVDEFGKDTAFTERVRPLLDWVYDKWFRVEAAGFEQLPRDVPLILVANRAGAVPWDSVMLTLAAQRAGLAVRPLVEDSIFHFPSMGLLVNRLGAIRASPENGERILARGEAVAVFPEGATGFGKPFRERYRLQRFGRGGFIKLALRTGALVVPVSIVGSEEIHPLLARLDLRPFGFPFLPITPTFPWLGVAGLLPFPSKWRIEAEEPFDFRRHGPEAAQDDPLVMRLAEEVRGTIQTMLDNRLAQRSSAFL